MRAHIGFARVSWRLAAAVALASAIGAVAFVSIGGAAEAVLPGEAQRHVVGEDEIQARIDLQIDQADADRQAIQALLQRADVRQIAGAAGLDVEQASAAAAVLSGSSLEKLAAQARMVDTDLSGGDTTIVVSATVVIIVLLILILLTS